MSLILNVVWVVLGGWLMALLWLLAAVLMAITVILLPWSRAAVEIANYTLWPFGRESIDRKLLTGRDDIGTGDLGFVGNVLWFLVAGDRPCHCCRAAGAVDRRPAAGLGASQAGRDIAGADRSDGGQQRRGRRGAAASRRCDLGWLSGLAAKPDSCRAATVLPYFCAAD